MTQRTLLPALLACLALAAAGCGGEDEPAKPAAASVDQAFVNRMASHVDLSRRIAAEGAEGTKTAAVRRLADRMVKARESELGTLRSLQQRFGGLRGGKDDPLGVSAQQAAETLRPDILRQAEPYDQVFLQLMVQHHQGGLTLIQAERKSGKDGAAKALADQLGQRRVEELNDLNDQLAKARG